MSRLEKINIVCLEPEAGVNFQRWTERTFDPKRSDVALNRQSCGRRHSNQGHPPETKPRCRSSQVSYGAESVHVYRTGSHRRHSTRQLGSARWELLPRFQTVDQEAAIMEEEVSRSFNLPCVLHESSVHLEAESRHHDYRRGSE